MSLSCPAQAGLGDLAAAYANASRCATDVVPDPTGLPLRDQIDAHAGGALLVAPHGAGLVHAAWLANELVEASSSWAYALGSLA